MSQVKRKRDLPLYILKLNRSMQQKYAYRLEIISSRYENLRYKSGGFNSVGKTRLEYPVNVVNVY